MCRSGVVVPINAPFDLKDIIQYCSPILYYSIPLVKHSATDLRIPKQLFTMEKEAISVSGQNPNVESGSFGPVIDKAAEKSYGTLDSSLYKDRN